MNNLKANQLDKVFDVIVSGKDDLGAYRDSEGTNKPKPYIYMEAAKQLQVSPEKCLVFEDSRAGVDAAKGAGMHVIAAPNDYTKGQNFSRADRVFHDYGEKNIKWVFDWLVAAKKVLAGATQQSI